MADSEAEVLAAAAAIVDASPGAAGYRLGEMLRANIDASLRRWITTEAQRVSFVAAIATGEEMTADVVRAIASSLRRYADALDEAP